MRLRATAVLTYRKGDDFIEEERLFAYPLGDQPRQWALSRRQFLIDTKSCDYIVACELFDYRDEFIDDLLTLAEIDS